MNDVSSSARVLIVAYQTTDSLDLRAAVAEGEVVEIVGSHDPLASVEDALDLLGLDEVIVSLLPARMSSWLRLDLPRKIRGLGVPVTEVVATERGVTPLSAA